MGPPQVCSRWEVGGACLGAKKDVVGWPEPEEPTVGYMEEEEGRGVEVT